MKDSHAQAIRRITKLFIFPPMIKGEAGRRVNPATPLEKVLGPHTPNSCVFTKGVFCFNRAAIYLPRAPTPEALCRAASGQN